MQGIHTSHHYSKHGYYQRTRSPAKRLNCVRNAVFLSSFFVCFMDKHEHNNPSKSLENQYSHIVIKIVSYVNMRNSVIIGQRYIVYHPRSWFIFPYLRFYINYNKFAWQRKYFSPLFIIVCTCSPSIFPRPFG